MARVLIDRGACNGCGACAAYCPTHVIEMAGGKAVAVRQEDCVECYVCVMLCPTKAIEIVEEPAEGGCVEALGPLTGGSTA